MLENLRKICSLLVCLGVLNGALLPIFGQNQSARRVTMSKPSNVAEAFTKINKFGRGADFVKALSRGLQPREIVDMLAWFDERDESFFRAVFEAHNQKAAEYDKRRFEKGLPQTIAEPVRQTVKPVPPQRTINKKRAGFETVRGAFFQNASYQSVLETAAPDEPLISTSETESGVKTIGELQNTVETAETLVTKGTNADTERIVNDAKNGQIYTQTSFEEVYNKITRGRVRNEKKFLWNYLIAQCPDAAGVVEGEGLITVENKATISNPTTTAIPAQVLTMKVKFKGFVGDDAQLTHYDLTGEVIETTSGFDRAKRLEMIDETSAADGTRQFTLSVAGNKFDGVSSKSAVGEVREGSTAHLSNAELNRMVDFTDQALPMTLIGADNGFATSRTNWQGGFCVDVSLAAPKETLKPGEKITVSAETVHKFDRSKIDANLEATGYAEVSPANQRAQPSARFNLTAGIDENFSAEITVKSVSRRGIGAKTLKFGKEKPDIKTKTPVKTKLPVKTKTSVKKCGAWTGKINVVKRKRVEKNGNPSGRLVRDIENVDETFNIEYNLIGIADTTQGFANAFYANSKINFRELRYSEKLYASGKMSCNKQIIASSEMRKTEAVMTGEGSARLTVFITSAGDKGILTFGSPELRATRITTRTYETSCPAYNQTNSGSDRYDGLIDIVSPIFEIEFELGADSDTQLNGAKTIQNEDGSESVVTWSLTRECK